MKKLSVYILLVSIVLGFSACKKYPEGGLHAFAFKHLTSDLGRWKLELYEVDGIDSTYLIKGTTQTLSIVPDGRLSKTLFLRSSYGTTMYSYSCRLEENKSILGGFYGDSTNHESEQREILNPERIQFFSWTITRLKRKELVLTANWAHSYRLKFKK